MVRSVRRPYLGELAYASGLILWESVGMCAFVLLPSLGEEGSSSLPWLDPSSLGWRRPCPPVPLPGEEEGWFVH